MIFDLMDNVFCINLKLISQKNLQKTASSKVTNLKNNFLAISVKVIPCLETFKCTFVVGGSGRLENNVDTAFLTASGPVNHSINLIFKTQKKFKKIVPVNDSVSHVNKYKTLQAAP